MDVLRITATELKCACADPLWLDEWIAGRASRVYPASQPEDRRGGADGALFHRLAENHVSWLVEDSGAEHIDTADRLWEELYRRNAAAALERLASDIGPVAAARLARALRAFCGQLARVRAAARFFKSWRDVYAGHEHPVQDVPFHFDKCTVFVSGRIDSLRRLPSHELEIADYKLHAGPDRERDILQVAIYAGLLAHNNPALRFHGALEYYLPALEILRFDANELRDIFSRRVHPVLARIAMATRSSAAPAPVAVSPGLQPSGRSHDEMAHRIQEVFKAFKLGVEVVDAIEAPQLIRFFLKPDPGVRFVSLAGRASDLQVCLGTEQPPSINPGKGAVTVDILKPQPETVPWREVFPAVENAGPLAFIIGKGVSGEVLLGDFADSNTAHALVGGSTGSGKSEFLKALLATLMARNSPDQLRLTLVDPKKLAFGPLEGSPFLNSPVVSDLEGAMPSMAALCDEMESRYTRLLAEGCNDVSQFIAGGGRDMPFHVLVADEFADLVLAGGETRREFETLLKRLSQKGRAAGIHLVLATQRPDRSIVNGLIKGNLPLKVCLRVTSVTNSNVLLDQAGGETLAGRGDLLCERGRGLERAQAPYLEPGEFRKLARLPSQ